MGPTREYKVYSFGWRLKLFFIIKQEKILLIYKMVIQTVLVLLDELARTMLIAAGLIQDVPEFLEGFAEIHPSIDWTSQQINSLNPINRTTTIIDFMPDTRTHPIIMKHI